MPGTHRIGVSVLSVMAFLLAVLILPSGGFCAPLSSAGANPNLTPGEVATLEGLPETEIAPGVKARLFWSGNALVAHLTLAPGAEIPRETLLSERIMVVRKGAVSQITGNTRANMVAIQYQTMTPVSGNRERNDLIYLEKGAPNGMKAGAAGAEVIEVYSPVRADYLKKAGVSRVPSGAVAPGGWAAPTVKPGVVYNLHDIQFAELARGAMARIISGRTVQASFLSLDPGYTGSERPKQEGIRMVLRGGTEASLSGAKKSMEKGNIALLAGGKQHGDTVGPLGCDLLEVYTPVRPDYIASYKRRMAAFHAIIPEDAKIELVTDGAKKGPGLLYGEGPSWVKGKIYFSNMYYDAKWNGTPANSALVEVDPMNGDYRYVVTGMELNGTYPMGGDRLAVNDTFGHKVYEMDTKGNIIRVIADKWNEVRLDGPNDLCVDNKGGVYFSDPQIMPEPHMQPGRSVFYARPNGEIIRIMAPGTLEKPNGLVLSPDCKTLYVNSTPEDFMLAYDVQPDGSCTNPRKFGKILVTPEIRDMKSVNPQVDGVKTDALGNVYITSIMGLQIFNPKGEFVGMIHFPLMPVNCCFGDPDGKTLYVLCNDKVYKIRTNVKGSPQLLKGL